MHCFADFGTPNAWTNKQTYETEGNKMQCCPTCKSTAIKQNGRSYRTDENGFNRCEDIYMCKKCGTVFKIIWAFVGYEYVTDKPTVNYWD